MRSTKTAKNAFQRIPTAFKHFLGFWNHNALTRRLNGFKMRWMGNKRELYCSTNSIFKI